MANRAYLSPAGKCQSAFTLSPGASFFSTSPIHSNSQTHVSGRRAHAHSTAGLDLSLMKGSHSLIDDYLVILIGEEKTGAEGWSGKGGSVKLVE